LLDNPDYAEEIANNAFDLLCSKYTTDHCANLLIDIYKEIAEGK